MALVSIILPTRNRPALLPRAIASVLAQTERDFELIVVDNAPVSAPAASPGHANAPAAICAPAHTASTAAPLRNKV